MRPSLPAPPRLALAAILLAYAVLAAGYNLATPMGEAPDEPSHVQYAMYLREERRLPVVPEGGGGRMPQGKHPPLYYLAGLALSGGDDFRTLGFIVNPHFRFDPGRPDVVAAFVHPPDQRWPYSPGERAARRMRLASLLAGLVTVAATWRIARLAWAGAPSVAAAAAAVVAFTPGFLALGGAFNNDAFAVAATSAALAAAAPVALGRAGPRGGAALGAALGLGLLSKLTTLMAWPLAAAAVAVDVARSARAGRAAAGAGVAEGSGVAHGAHASHRTYRTHDAPAPPSPRTPAATLRTAAAVAATAGALAAPWLVRGALLYGWRDPLGVARWADSIPHLARTVPLRDELGAYLGLQYQTFWGRFGWSSIPMPGWTYAAIGIALGAAAVGLSAVAARLARGRRAARRAGARSDADDPRALVLGLCVVAAVLAYAQTLRLGLQLNLVAAHGRYLYVALPALGVLLASGLIGPLPPRARGPAAAALCAAWLALGGGALVGVVRPAFAAPEPVPTAELANLPRADAAFGDALRLVGWRVAGGLGAPDPDDPALARVLPDTGDPRSVLEIALYWTALRPLWHDADAVPNGPRAPSHAFFAHLVGSAGEVVGRADAVPLGGAFPTGTWPPGDVYRQDLRIRVDGNAPFGRAAIHVGAYPYDRPELRLPVVGVPGATDHAVVIAPVVVARQPAGDVPPATRPIAAFGAEPGDDALILEAVATAPGADGAPAVLTTTWRAGRWAGEDLTLFVHVVDAAGALLATADGPPLGGGYPTSLWAPGEVVADVRTLPAAPGAAAIRVGWYDAATGERRWAEGPGGAPWPDGAAEVARSPWR